MDDPVSPLESRLAPDPTPDELIAKSERRRREWGRLRRQFEAWLAAHAETEECLPI
ncbi:MAG: hypothetical protein FD119_2597 [Stygiobacter sp.]|nr:MAG: hypothetical protein FD119_2597 [Stygiobacter sp.]